MLSNYNYDIYSDTTHFNTKGYDILAARITSLFIGEGLLNKKKIDGGTILGVRPTIDNIFIIKNAIIQSSGGVPTPGELDNKGVNIGILEGGEVIYSFYNEIENLIIAPSLLFNSDSTSVELSIDSNTEIPDTTIDYSLLSNKTIDFRPSNPITLNKSNANWRGSKDVYCSAGIRNLKDDKYILLTTKGWHTLTIKCTSGSASLFGVEFITFLDLYNRINSEKTNQYILYTHDKYTDTNEVAKSVVSFKEIFNALKYNDQSVSQYIKNPPLRINVYNYDKCLLEYLITINTNGSCRLSKQFNKYDFVDNPTGYRELDSIQRIDNNLELIWKGTINRATTIIISNV